jgi:hypothetical protein
MFYPPKNKDSASIALRSILARDIQLVSPVETIVPREPVRTTLRSAPSAALCSAPSGVRSGTHSWPNVSTGGTLF